MARHAASLLSILPAPRCLTLAHHLATTSCLHEKRRGNRSGSRRERRCTPPRRPASASTSPLEQRYKPSLPRPFLGTKISQRERIRSSTGDVMANLTVSHQLVAPFNCIHYDECHLSSSRRHVMLLAFNNTLVCHVSFRDNLFSIMSHFISVFFNYLFNVFEN